MYWRILQLHAAVVIINKMLLPGIKNDENICFVAVSSNKRHDLRSDYSSTIYPCMIILWVISLKTGTACVMCV